MAGPIVREMKYYTIGAIQNVFENLGDVVGELPSDLPDVVPILFKLCRWVKSGLIYNEDDKEPARWEFEGNRVRQFEVIKDLGLSSLNQLTHSEIDQLKDRFIDILSNKFHVPESEHQTTIDKIFREIARHKLRPLFPLQVSIFDCTYRYRLYTPDLDDEDLEDLSLDDDSSRQVEACSICINEFDATAAPVARLPSCKHVFHRDCILRWLHRKPFCPMCRCPSQKKNRKLDEVMSSSTATAPPSNIPRTTT